MCSVQRRQCAETQRETARVPGPRRVCGSGWGEGRGRWFTLWGQQSRNQRATLRASLNGLGFLRAPSGHRVQRGTGVVQG